MGKNEPDKRTSISVEKKFNTNAERVFNAWLNKNMISRWMFGPSVRDEEIISLKNTSKQGGNFSFVVKRGSDVIDHVGTYLEITPFSRLVFTWGVEVEAGPESVVTITIQPTESGCLLTLVHDMDIKWVEYTQRTKEGWTYMLNKLELIII